MFIDKTIEDSEEFWLAQMIMPDGITEESLSIARSWVTPERFEKILPLAEEEFHMERTDWEDCLSGRVILHMFQDIIHDPEFDEEKYNGRIQRSISRITEAIFKKWLKEKDEILKGISPKQLSVLKYLRDNTDDDMIVEGTVAWYGDERTSVALVNKLLKRALISPTNDDKKVRYYKINEAGLRLLECKPPYCDGDGNYHKTMRELMKRR